MSMFGLFFLISVLVSTMESLYYIPAASKQNTKNAYLAQNDHTTSQVPDPENAQKDMPDMGIMPVVNLPPEMLANMTNEVIDVPMVVNLPPELLLNAQNLAINNAEIGRAHV